MHNSSSSKSTNTVTTEKELPQLPQRLESPGLRQRIRQICIHLWIWELLSLLLCMSCVGAIVIILLRYDGRPLPDWKYGLTINGVISVLAGVAKASMILPVAESISQLKWHWFWNGRSRPIVDFEYFDTASRGPWGCLVLLCRPRQWSVVTAGALITVLALLMEPSLQFIPAYPLHSVPTARASAPRSTYYKDILLGEQPDPSSNFTASLRESTSPIIEAGSADSLRSDVRSGHSDKERLSERDVRVQRQWRDAFVPDGKLHVDELLHARHLQFLHQFDLDVALESVPAIRQRLPLLAPA